MLIGIDGNEANVENRVGSNQYAYELLRTISANLPAGRQGTTEHMFVIYLRDQPLPDMPEAGGNWQYRVIKPRKLWTQFRLPLDLYLHKPRPDIFFTPGHYSPRWSPIDRVISIMDLGFLRFKDQFTKKDYYQLTQWTKRSVKSAKHIFAISESTKNAIIKAYGIPKEKITVTYPGYDKAKFEIRNSKFEIEKIKEKYGITGKYILFLSTLKPSKNIEGLLEAYKILNSDMQLVIAGKKGWLFESIFGKTKELGLKEKVIFTDYVPDSEVPALISGAEVFVLPSYWEGFGIPVVEAMASGVPVVVSNAGSLPEIVGEAGIVVNPNNFDDIAQGINKAINNRKVLVEKGLEQIKKYSWDKCTNKTIETLESLIK